MAPALTDSWYTGITVATRGHSWLRREDPMRFQTLALSLLTACLSPLAAAGDGPTGPEPVLLLSTGTTIGSLQVLELNEVRLTPGGYQVLITTQFDRPVLLVNGSVYHFVDQAIPGTDLTVDDVGLGDSNLAGQVATIVRAESSSGDFRSVLLMDGQLRLDEGDLVQAAGLPAGSTWVGLKAAMFDGEGGLLVGGAIEDPSVSLLYEEAFVRYDVAPNGSLSGGTTLLAAGQVVAEDLSIRLLIPNTKTSYAAGDPGSVLANVGLENGAGTEFPYAIVRDGEPLILDGEPSPIPNRDWVVEPFDPVDQAAAGRWAARVSVSGGGGFGGLPALVRDGAIWASSGGIMPERPATQVQGLGWVRLSDTGNMLWDARFLDGGATRHVLMVNDQILVEEGVTTSGGVPLDALSTFGWGEFDIQPDGTSVMFMASKAGSPEQHLFAMHIGPWVSQGYALPDASSGPTLVANGSQHPGAKTRVEIRDGLPSAPAGIILGLSELGAPFKGGVLCPTPDLVVDGLSLDAQGGFLSVFPFPAGVPTGTELYWQGWVVDPAGPKGLTATNCLVSLAP
jgi:hypothetical protein